MHLRWSLCLRASTQCRGRSFRAGSHRAHQRRGHVRRRPGRRYLAVFHWHDEWHPLHEAKVDAALLASFTVPDANLPARALVAQLREETCALFAAQGGASNQIGRTYPFVEVLGEAPLMLLRGIKQQLDPKARMNPGVLGL